MIPSRRAVVLHGAAADRPDEQDTLVQAGEVAGALERLGWEARIEAVGFDLSRLEALLDPRPALVFNLVESLAGDGRLVHLVPGVLEHLGIPFTGAPATAHFATTDKLLAKRLLFGAGLLTPAWSGEGGQPVPRQGQVIVKSVHEDASIGLDARSVVPAALMEAEIAARSARFGGQWFAEAYIEGREFNVGLLEDEGGLRVLPVAEILFLDFPPERPRIVDYEAKWLEDSFAYHHTPRRFDLPASDGALLEELGRLAEAAFRLFGLRGYGRVDFRVDAQGHPWILEVNANPCLAADAGYMAAAGRAGLSLDEVVARLASAAVDEGARAAA